MTMDFLDCATCGKRAACVGRYEAMTDIEPACDECCGHGCEDGLCHRVDIEDDTGILMTFYRWSCACGVEGAWMNDREAVERNAHAHLASHIEAFYR